jgi:hypothetical protein
MLIFERDPVVAENQQPLSTPTAVGHEAENSGTSKQSERRELYLSSHLYLYLLPVYLSFLLGNSGKAMQVEDESIFYRATEVSWKRLTADTGSPSRKILCHSSRFSKRQIRLP